MVATRRGARVNSPTKTKPEQPSDVQDTPSTGRRTRRAAKLEETLAETCSKLEKSEDEALPPDPTSTKKRCTRASRLHSPEQPCTPVGSTHEADVSDLESCCSAVSDPDPPAKSTRRKRQSHAENQADEVSEVESCSSAVSGSKAGHSTRRSTRKKTVPESSDIAQAEAGAVKVELTLETESCSSVVSESQRVTRSQRKTARTRSTAKKHTEDSELSDADSCTSAASRRRSRRQIQPIPLHLDELSESSQSPVRITRRTRAAGRKVETTLDVSEPPSCESEGLECGPTKSLTTLRRGRSRSAGPKDVDSDSEVTNVHSSVGSPGSTRGRGTPCSSRTGSGTSSRGAPASRRSVKDCSVVLENTDTLEDNSLNDSRLENTVIAEDADCTLLEENEMERSEVQEGKNTSDRSSSDTNTENLEKEIIEISDDNSHIGPSVSVFPEDTSEPAVIAVDQQEEPSTETNDRDASEMETMQETVPPSEPSGPCSSVTVTICEKASEMTEEAEEEQEAADTHLSETDKPLDEDAVVETQLDGEEKMEVNMLKTEVQQVADTSAAQAEPIQVTSVQQHRVTVDSESEPQPKDVIIQKTKIISLLDSSDDDEFDEEERDVSEEEDLEPMDEERAGPSNKSEAAAASVDGLFMIDTRPGQEADEDYYREGREEETEQEEDEFVDEEVEDDDDDEDAKVLFSSRDSHSKELSSRIDPGIRLKELGGLYISFDGSKSKPDSSSLQKLKEKKIQDEVMKKSVIGPDFEKKDAVPPYSESKQAIKLKRRAEREKSTGDGWFNMKAPEMSQELKGDLQALKMRGSVDPKRFYKKNDRDGFPKYFQFGEVVDSPVDFYHSRIPKKERKRTMVEELLADADFRHQNKKRFQQIMMEKAAQGAGKRNNKKKKFHKT